MKLNRIVVQSIHLAFLKPIRKSSDCLSYSRRSPRDIHYPIYIPDFARGKIKPYLRWFLSFFRFRIDWQFFNLQPGDCSKDYLEIYDCDKDAVNSTYLIGRFCGKDGVNIDGYPTDRYLTLKFVTDGSDQRSGFKLRATRWEQRMYNLFACLLFYIKLL